MEKLNELIAELCPHGVPYYPISELGTLTRGKRFVHADAVDEGIPCIHYGELYTYYGIATEKTKLINDYIVDKGVPEVAGETKTVEVEVFAKTEERRERMAKPIIGEKSRPPILRGIFEKSFKKGSQIAAKNCPIGDQLCWGIQLIKILIRQRVE